jgi:hypothetical protein
MSERRGRRPPPEHTRFKPGQSGNPLGRPKGRKNLQTVANEVLGKRVTVHENGRPVKRTVLEVFIQQIANDSLKGNSRARELFLRLTQSVDAHNAGQAQQASPEVAAVDDGLVPDSDTLRLILRRFGHLRDDEQGE